MARRRPAGRAPAAVMCVSFGGAVARARSPVRTSVIRHCDVFPLMRGEKKEGLFRARRRMRRRRSRERSSRAHMRVPGLINGGR